MGVNMKYLTIRNAKNWQTVQVNLLHVNPLHMHNIHVTREDNGDIAVLFQVGYSLYTKHDNKIVCENTDEAIVVLEFFITTFEHVLPAYSHVLEKFAIG